jgi:hypothetical protein
MVTTTPSVPDSSSSVSATDALSRLRGELTEELCVLAVRLAHFAIAESLAIVGACLACGNSVTGDSIPHADGCTIEQTLRVVGRLEILRLEQRRLESGAPISERQIIYGPEIPAPVGFSHVEAAVLQAAGVPWEQRSVIYAEAMARQAADDLEAGR